ncbi:unnamed protein product [Paramecium pentaurelia]|uniref:Uncharacterized protein n=1 Tax=Paramecium pentaurelia TaxID=43138 RepID=A0A8S1YEZ0_9CILI|nr:unnamed protein product [Paramecium pentaurelia]
MKQKIDRSRIPNSSQDILIVPVYADKLGFSLPAKLPYMPVSEDSIAETVFQANRICQKIRCEKSRIEESDPLETEKFYVTSSWVLFIVGVILFVLGFSYEDFKSTLTLLGTIFIVLPTLISIIVVIISITKSPKLIDLEQECTKKLGEFFEVQNQQYRKKGLQWSIGDEMLWIQLEKI